MAAGIAPISVPVSAGSHLRLCSPSRPFLQIRTQRNFLRRRTTPNFSIRAEYNDRRGGGSGGDFVAGFLLGGAIFGALAYVFAPQNQGNSHMFEHITASEVAGYGVGALLLWATVSATKVDSLIAASQRSSIGMCERCGDLRLVACSTCRGSGLIAGPGQFNFNLVGDFEQSFRAKPTKMASVSCAKCQARGHFCCPKCSKVSSHV